MSSRLSWPQLGVPSWNGCQQLPGSSLHCSQGHRWIQLIGCCVHSVLCCVLNSGVFFPLSLGRGAWRRHTTGMMMHWNIGEIGRRMTRMTGWIKSLCFQNPNIDLFRLFSGPSVTAGASKGCVRFASPGVHSSGKWQRLGLSSNVALGKSPSKLFGSMLRVTSKSCNIYILLYIYLFIYIYMYIAYNFW